MKRIIVAGGSGFLGRALAAHFLKAQWDVVILTRSPNQTGGAARELAWDACTVGSWWQELEDATALVGRFISSLTYFPGQAAKAD